MIPDNSGPVLVTLVVLTVLAGIVLRVSRGTSRRLVEREYDPVRTATYRRAATPERVARQVEARKERQQQALVAAKIARVTGLALASVWVFAFFYGTALVFDSDSNVRAGSLVAAAVACAALMFFIKPYDATFPQLPERDAYVEPENDPVPSFAAEANPDRFARPQRKASPQRRQRRRKTELSRKKNRQR